MLQPPHLQVEPLYFLTHLLNPSPVFLIIANILLLRILRFLRLLFDDQLILPLLGDELLLRSALRFLYLTF